MFECLADTGLVQKAHARKKSRDSHRIGCAAFEAVREFRGLVRQPAVAAGAAFAWAALRGEFTDAEQTAFLVFDDEDALAAERPPSPESTP